MIRASLVAGSFPRLLAVLALGAVALATGAEAQSPAAPSAPRRVKPATPDDVEFRPGILSLVTDEATGQPYLVLTYVVANRTGKTQRFTPRFELLMGDGTMLDGGRDVPADVAARLRRAAAGERALDQFQVMGDIADGESNAKEGFVVWPARGDMKEFTLFVTGISAAWDMAPEANGGASQMLRRTWTRHYSIAGAPHPASAAQASFDPLKDAWIMRGTGRPAAAPKQDQ